MSPSKAQQALAFSLPPTDKNSAPLLSAPIIAAPIADAAASLPFVDYEAPQKPFCGLILVGEAPGAEESRLGRPFVGRSGQLLDQILTEAGIDRQTCWILNVFRFRPPNNKIDAFFATKSAANRDGISLSPEWGQFSGKACRKPYSEEISNLFNKINEVKPALTVALGRTAFWALTGLDGLLQARGKLFPLRKPSEGKVMPTYHPSFILRGNWRLRPEWVDDLKKSQSLLIGHTLNQ